MPALLNPATVEVVTKSATEWKSNGVPPNKAKSYLAMEFLVSPSPVVPNPTSGVEMSNYLTEGFILIDQVYGEK